MPQDLVILFAQSPYELMYGFLEEGDIQMILVTITRAREKFLMVLKLLLLVLLLGLLVPKLFMVLSNAGSLQRWAEKDQLPQEPMRVEQVAPDQDGSTLWSHIVNSFK